MIKTILIVIALLFITADVTMAQEATTTSASPSPSVKPSITSERAARKETITQNKANNTSDRLAKGIERGAKEIDRRVESLNKLIEKINSMKKISASSKNTFVSQIQAQIDSLEALKAKIQADTDLTSLKTDLQSVVKDYRIYALYMPKIRIFVAADRLAVTADNLSSYSSNLNAKILEKETAGQDMSEAKEQILELNSLIASAKSKYAEAIAIATPLLPEGYPDNKDEIKSAQEIIKSGAKDLKSAFSIAIEIRKLLGEKPQGSLSPSKL